MLRQRLIRFMLDTFGMVQSSLVGQLKMSWPTREMRSISFVPSHLCHVKSPWLANSRLGTPLCNVRLFQPDLARPDQISPGHRPGMADPLRGENMLCCLARRVSRAPRAAAIESTSANDLPRCTGGLDKALVPSHSTSFDAASNVRRRLEASANGRSRRQIVGRTFDVAARRR